MKSQKLIALIAVLAMLIGPVTPAFAVSKEIVQLQTQVQALSDQMARMQQTFDERMGVMRNLIEQSTDNVNKLAASVDTVQRSLQQENTNTQAKIDQVSGQVQSLHDSLDEMKARMAKLSKQLDDMNAASENLNAAQPGMGAALAPPAAPPADVLYNNALRDYNSGRYDLAMGQFADYLKFYATTELAGNAQFYVADIEYRQGNFEQAVKDYDKVLEQYPSGNKAAASQLKKGYALLELGQRDAGVRELNSLMQRYPRSIEAQQARERLRKAGVTGTKPSATRRR
ncbi:MAG TPA: tetratricopeptide repeat protein [Clostridia bacterium]|nr:tetratricopeptide repeat protein [Clostridia bacterium]